MMGNFCIKINENSFNFLTATNELKSSALSTPTTERANNFPDPNLTIIAEIQHHYAATVNLRVALVKFGCCSLWITILKKKKKTAKVTIGTKYHQKS